MIVTHTAIAPNITDPSGQTVDGPKWNAAHTISWPTDTNTIQGYNAGKTPPTQNINATLYGAGAGQALSTGLNNSCVGYSAGLAMTIGADNSLFGVNAGASIIDGFGNTIVGSNAGLLVASGTGNTIIGNAAGQACVNSNYNVYTGKFAGQLETGQANVYDGYKAGFVSTNGNRNTYLGNSAGITATTGTDNTFVGYNAANGITSGSANTIIGANVVGLIPTLANTVILADGGGNVRLQIGSTGQGAFGTAAPLTSLGSGGTHFGVFDSVNGGGFQAASNATTDGSDVGSFEIGTFGTAGGEKRVGAIHGFLVGSAAAAVTGKLVFYTSNAGAIAERMHLDASGVTATAYNVGSSPGISASVTTASLVGKTLTIVNGIVTAFS